MIHNLNKLFTLKKEKNDFKPQRDKKLFRVNYVVYQSSASAHFRYI